METYIQSKGHYETNINGNVIDKSKWNVVYDGDTMNLETRHNGEHLYMNLDNEDIMKLFELPSNDKTIDQRLENRLLNINTEEDMKPIIIEKLILNAPVSRRRSSRKSKSHSKSKHSSRKSKSHSKSKHSSKKSKSHSKSHSKSKHSSRKSKSTESKKNQRQITPDYLKTIY